MELDRADAGGCAVVRISGVVRPEDAPSLREALDKAVAQVPTCLVCDLSAVTRLSPVCVAVLVAAQWTAPWPGPVVWLAGAHGQPAEALGATGAARFLSTADSVSAALAAQDAEPRRLRERLVLAPLPTAPRHARRFAEEVLARWGVSHVSDDAMLVVSELVTNGVQHAGSDLELRLEHGRGLLQIAVRDRGSPYVGPALGELPEAAAVFDGFHDTMLERGRGLEIVQTVADGAGQTDDPGGGSVYWATLRTAPRRGPARTRSTGR
jgi:anti-sigma regulatory factor (Ser/Thr protein kinase)/anti-anti-sigma regulatory factor